MSVTDGDLTAGFRAAGLAARRRDVPAIAVVFAMGNGTLARQLGWCGLVLLPVTGPVHAMVAALALPVIVRRRGAAGVICPPGGTYRPDRVALAAAGVVLLVIEMGCVLLGIWLGVPWWAALLVIGVIVVDLCGGLVTVVRLRCHAVPDLQRTAADLGAVSVSSVAAFPRDGGRGTALMRAVQVVLDDHGLPAILDARPSLITRRRASKPRRSRDLIGWYSGLGYRTTPTWQRMVRQPGCNTAPPPQQM